MKHKMLGTHAVTPFGPDGFVKKKTDRPLPCSAVNAAATRSLEKRGIYTVSRSESYVPDLRRATG